MVLKIPNQTMKWKLEPLLHNDPGEFEHGPKVVLGLNQLIIFKRNGIPCPEFTTDLNVAKAWAGLGQVFGRIARHEKGEDIVDQTSPAWVRRQFWSKVIPHVSREYRIHIFDGEHIQQGLKYFDPKAPRTRHDNLPIRNTSTGWKYDHSFQPPAESVRLAKQAVRVLEYLWGAVDLLEDEDRVYVLEANTAPGMDETTAPAYADAIRRYVLRRRPRRAA